MAPPRRWSVEGRLCLVTGATSGIGRATAMALAAEGAHLVLPARQAERGRAITADILGAHPGARVTLLPCDLARLDDVRRLADTILSSYERLDVLVNNAAVVDFRHRTTPGGHPLAVVVNHLAPFLLSTLLLPALCAADAARVVTVTSDNHSTVAPFAVAAADDPSPLRVYNRTKLMNIWFTRALASRLDGTTVTANCVAPGFARTGLARDATGPFGVFIRLAGPFQSSPQKAARPVVQLVTDPTLSGRTGGYYSKGSVRAPSHLAQSREDAQRLWDFSETTTRSSTVEF